MLRIHTLKSNVLFVFICSGQVILRSRQLFRQRVSGNGLVAIKLGCVGGLLAHQVGSDPPLREAG